MLGDFLDIMYKFVSELINNLDENPDNLSYKMYSTVNIRNTKSQTIIELNNDNLKSYGINLPVDIFYVHIFFGDDVLTGNAVINKNGTLMLYFKSLNKDGVLKEMESIDFNTMIYHEFGHLYNTSKYDIAGKNHHPFSNFAQMENIPYKLKVAFHWLDSTELIANTFVAYKLKNKIKYNDSPLSLMKLVIEMKKEDYINLFDATNVKKVFGSFDRLYKLSQKQAKRSYRKLCKHLE